jgi:O-antigen/teichoic acid export membrane protein
MTSAVGHDRRRLIVNAVVNWLGFAAQIAVAFYLSPLLVHSLGDERNGLWALAQSVMVWVTLLDLGVAASLVRYTARFEAVKDTASLNRTFSASLLLFTAAGLAAMLIAAAVTGLGLWLPAPWSAAGAPVLNVPAAHRGEATAAFLLVGLNLALSLPLNVFPSLLDGLGRYPAKTAIRTAGLLLRLPLCVWLVPGEGGLVRLALIQLGCNVLEHLALAVAARRYLPGLRFVPRQVDRATLRAIGGYSVHALVAMLAGRMSFQTDALVITQCLGAALVTPFGIAHALVEQAKSALRAVTTVLTPAVSAWEARQDDAAIRGLLLNGTRWMQWLIVPVQMGILVLGPAFLALWQGPRYRLLSTPTLIILALPLGLVTAQSIASRILYGIGRLALFARLVLAEALANLVLSIALAGPLGIEGVALGTVLPNLVCTVAVIFHVCGLLGIKRSEYVRKALLPPHLVGLPLGLGWWLAVHEMPIESWIDFLIIGTLGMAVYLPCAALVEFGPNALWARLRGLVPLAPNEAKVLPALGENRSEAGNTDTPLSSLASAAPLRTGRASP